MSDWRTLAPGLEQGTYTGIIALRVDPQVFMFRAHYAEPRTLRGWSESLPGAVAFVNANFFDPQDQVLGLLITDGQVFGIPYTNRGGWFGVQNGLPFVRSTVTMPYRGEPLEQAVQAFPMLVENGQQAYTRTEGDRITRRTAIGQDIQGRIVLIATPGFGMTLAELSALLAESDMGLVTAFNLDGGGSTMMYFDAGDETYRLGSLDPVPVILAVYPR